MIGPLVWTVTEADLQLSNYCPLFHIINRPESAFTVVDTVNNDFQNLTLPDNGILSINAIEILRFIEQSDTITECLAASLLVHAVIFSYFRIHYRKGMIIAEDNPQELLGL